MAPGSVLDWLRYRGSRTARTVILSDASMEGNALAVACRSERRRSARDSWPRRWWRGSGRTVAGTATRASGRRSSFHESHVPMWALAEYATATGTMRHGAPRPTAELFLSHRLFRRGGTGSQSIRRGSCSTTRRTGTTTCAGDAPAGRMDRVRDERAADALDLLEKRACRTAAGGRAPTGGNRPGRRARRRRRLGRVTDEMLTLNACGPEGAGRLGIAPSARPGGALGPEAPAILEAPMKKFLSRLVDSNEREVRRLEPLVAAINELEPEYEAMSDAELRGVTATLRARLQDELGELLTPIELRDVPPGEEEETELAGDDPARHSEERKEQRKREREQIDAALEEILPEAFAAVREAMKRALGKRHYDVQLIGGMVLHRGAIAEMKTGEGKTFVAPLAAYLNGLTGRGVHVVTVNDYLAKRDAQWIGAVFHRLGMAVGSIQHDAAYLYDPDFPQTDERLRNLRPVPRGEAYAADVTYGTNNEFGFDYLRDNLVIDLAQRVQREPLLRHRGRGRQHPDRRGADPADHLRPGGGIGRQVHPVRAADSPAHGGGGLHRRREVQAGGHHRGRHRQDGALAGGGQPVRQRLQHGPPPRAGAEGGGPLPARPRLRGQGRRGRHRRRVHRAPDARPPLERGPAPGGGGQGRGQDPERVADAGDRHLPELLPHVRQAGGHDRYRRDRGGGVRQDLRPGGRGGAHQPRHGPRRLRRPRLPQPERASGTRSSTRSPRSTRRGGRSWSARSAWRSARCSARC